MSKHFVISSMAHSVQPSSPVWTPLEETQSSFKPNHADQTNQSSASSSAQAPKTPSMVLSDRFGNQEVFTIAGQQVPKAKVHQKLFAERDQLSWLDRTTPDSASNLPCHQAQDRIAFQGFLVRNAFPLPCDYEQCAPKLYFNWPHSCPCQHKATYLVVEPRKLPFTKCPRIEVQPSFEALHLAQSAIDSFVQPREEWNRKQEDALSKFKRLFHEEGLRERLGLPKCSNHMRPDDMKTVTETFNEIFFLGAISPIHFTWQTHDLEPCSGYTKSPIDPNGRT